MTSFVNLEYPTEHPGVVRVEKAFATLQDLASRLAGARGIAALLLAAAVSTLLVLVNQVMDVWGSSQSSASWLVLWLVAFFALALLTAPARRAGSALHAAAHVTAAQSR